MRTIDEIRVATPKEYSTPAVRVVEVGTRTALLQASNGSSITDVNNEYDDVFGE